jgi:hypothetical protein
MFWQARLLTLIAFALRLTNSAEGVEHALLAALFNHSMTEA